MTPSTVPSPSPSLKQVCMITESDIVSVINVYGMIRKVQLRYSTTDYVGKYINAKLENGEFIR